MFFCLEILGEGAIHKHLIQTGWSGRSYVFRYNRPTCSHVRAYRKLEDYLTERVDIHKPANIWPLLGNLLPEVKLEAHVFAESLSDETAEVSKAALSSQAAQSLQATEMPLITVTKPVLMKKIAAGKYKMVVSKEKKSKEKKSK